jgi:large subunit ribosomal protein L22
MAAVDTKKRKASTASAGATGPTGEKSGSVKGGPGKTDASAPTVQAIAKYVRISPRKARLVADNIRGRSVPEARTILAFTTRAAAIEVEKVMRSAVANAESNPALLWNGDDLVVAAVYIDEGPTLKRWRARARGRVARIRKRTCHITVKVSQGPAAVTATAPAAKPKRAPRRPTNRKKDA